MLNSLISSQVSDLLSIYILKIFCIPDLFKPFKGKSLSCLCSLANEVSRSPHTYQLADAFYSPLNLRRILTEDFPRTPYRRRKGENKTTVHFGQRKLLLAEIEFLTLACCNDGVSTKADSRKMVVSNYSRFL